jgi:hypothetical protein
MHDLEKHALGLGPRVQTSRIRSCIPKKAIAGRGIDWSRMTILQIVILLQLFV